MEGKFLIILSGFMIIIGFTFGFYVAMAYQEQIQVLLGAAVILAILTWIGTGADFLGLLREWWKEKKEEEQTPTLKAGKIYKNSDNVYFLTLQKVRGDGLVEECAAYLTVQGTSINNSASIWEHAAVREYDIGTRQGLRLFRIYHNKEIYFPAAGIDTHFSENHLLYDETIKKELIIDFQQEKEMYLQQ